MFKGLCTSLLVAFLVIPALDADAQYRRNDEVHASHGSFEDERASPNRSAETAFGDESIVIEWGAPSVKGRTLYGRLIPEGDVWRTGANEATVIHLGENVRIEGQPLDAGNYALFTIGSEDEWTFIFNKVQYQWGAFSYNEEEDALRVTVTPEEGEHQEELLFSFVEMDGPGTHVRLNWGSIQVGFDVQPAE